MCQKDGYLLDRRRHCLAIDGNKYACGVSQGCINCQNEISTCDEFNWIAKVSSRIAKPKIELLKRDVSTNSNGTAANMHTIKLYFRHLVLG